MPKKSHYDVISIGTATLDTFLISKSFASYQDHGEPYLIINSMQKLDIPDIATDVGGGATNTAVTFARTGLRVAAMAKIGIDGPGREVQHCLEKEKIDNLLVHDRGHQTGISVVLKGPNGEDTILTHRGAGYEYSRKDFNLNNIQTHWLYISSLGGDLGVLERLIKWAKLQGVRVAVNPGQLEIARRLRLILILKQADVVVLNHTEIAHLFKTQDLQKCLSLARRADWHTIVITDSSQGSWVLDGSYLYRSAISKRVKVIDRTGAGDAFGSGLIAAIIRGKSMQEAISFASANATNVISYIGAHTGILRSLDEDIIDSSISIFESSKQEPFHVTPH